MNIYQGFEKLIKFHSSISNRIITRESNSIEFKQSFNWISKDRYARTIAAFSNNRGGSIVFGVKNSPRELIGLTNERFEEMDEARIAEYLNSVFSPEILWYKFVYSVKKKKLGIIIVESNTDKPVVCIKNDGILREAEIYYRYNARNDKIKYPELKALLEDIREKEKESWMRHFEKISKIGPSGAAVIDILNGRIDGQRGTLLIDKKLLPKLKFIKEGIFKKKGWPTLRLIGDVKPVSVVAGTGEKDGFRITSDPDAPVFQIEEKNILNKFPLDYEALTKNLRKRYVDFRVNQKYHRLRNTIKKSNGFYITRRLNPKNPKTSKQDFYSKRIYKEFDKYYTKKTKGRSK